MNIPIIGITGTNGKTTTKELTLAILSKKYNTIATEGNFNNHIGVPLTLLKIKKEHEIAIIEMGANHLGEIADLCKIANPNYGIITNVGKAHLEGFGSFKNIIKTKLALYESVTSIKGTIFFLKENIELYPYIKDSNYIEYSCKDLNSENFGNGNISKSFLEFTLNNIKSSKIEKINIKTKMIGLYNQSNILAAITIGDYFNVPLKKTKAALENYIPSNNRSQLEETSKNKLILDAYNANPSSVTNAIDNIKEIKHSKKLIILGDMLELGKFSTQEHQKIVEQIISKRLKTILIGSEFKKTKYQNSNLISKYNNSKELIDTNILNEIKDTLILIKGSRGMKLEQLIEYL